MNSQEFLLDLHVSNLLVFAPGTVFYGHELYRQGVLILQDKASCFPVQCLEADLRSRSDDEELTCLDACAAPGMKTTQLASLCSKTIAVERDFKRCETLKQIVQGAGAEEVVQIINQDFLKVKADELQNVEYIILDPSCSGSGMNRIGDQSGKKDPHRILSLSRLQTMLLKHALTFPKVKKVVYSTCSIYREENENVVAEVLDSNPGFKLDKCLESWHRRGDPESNLGPKKAEKCIRAEPKDDLTIGFFVAVFKRRKEKKNKSKTE